MAALQKWDTLSMACSSLLGLLGLALLVTCTREFFGPTRAYGQLVSLGNVALGLLGLVACTGLVSILGLSDCLPSSGGGLRGTVSAAAAAAAGRASLRTALLVGLVVAGMGTSSLLNQLSTDVVIHCGLAEAFVRVSHLEAKLTALKHDEMITQVFFRLNEMDDMLDLVQEGAIGVGEARTLMHNARMQDKAYINHRIGRLQKHAESVAAALKGRLAEVKTNMSSWRSSSVVTGEGAAAAAQPMHTGGPEPTSLPGRRRQEEEALWLLEKRIEAVDSVIRYLDTKSLAGELRYDEYEVILSALVEGGSAGVGGWAAGADVINIDTLKKEQGELPKLKDAFRRLSEDEYAHSGVVGPHLNAVQQIKKKRDEARLDFENRFMGVLDQHAPVHPATFHESLMKALDDLPAECMTEVVGYKVAWWLILATLAAQMLSAYTALTAVVHVAAHKQD